MKNIAMAIAAATICGSACAEEEAQAPEGVKDEQSSVVSAEFGLAFDSKYMTYGVVDGKDPILTPSAKVTFADWVYFGVSSIFDVTKANGRRGDYGNRAGKYTTIDASVGLAHKFDLGEEVGNLGFDFNYIYEYVRRYHDDDIGDTQYLNLELTLEGHWITPTLWIERDIMADEGTYANLSLGHGFEVAEGLTFTPSVAQGLGNTQRTRGYFADSTDGFGHGGLMDTTIKGELEWCICDNVALSCYLAYSDYWLDGNMRDAARAYNAEWGKSCDHSWNFYGGVGVTVSF